MENKEVEMILTRNIVGEDLTNTITNKTLKIISESLKKSLGPYGANTIIQSPMKEQHTITKDGYTIFDSIKFDNPIAQTILDIVKKISRKLVNEVGDGSTSSVIIANEMYEETLQLIHSDINYLTPKIIIDILGYVSELIKKELLKVATPITNENFDRLIAIASVSNNNDKELGKLVANLYKEIGADGFIDLNINSKGTDSYSQISEGYEFDFGYVSSIFVNQSNKLDYISENPFILMCNDGIDETCLEDLTNLMGKVIELQRPLVILAKNYDSSTFNFFKMNKMKNGDRLNICPITIPLGNDKDRAILEDFATFVGGIVWDKYYNNLACPKDLSDLGECRKVVINEKSSKFIGENYSKSKELTERYQSRLNELDKFIESLKKDDSGNFEERIFALEHRKGKLQCKVAKLYVGGQTDLEKRNKKYLLEDSIYACRSALKNGYVIGGNLSIPFLLRKKEVLNNIIDKTLPMIDNILMDKREKVTIIIQIINIISQSFLHSYYCVLSNMYIDEDQMSNIVEKCLKDKCIFNLVTGGYENKESTSIINSVSTDIEILNACNSIVGLIVSSNQFIGITTTATNNNLYS